MKVSKHDEGHQAILDGIAIISAVLFLVVLIVGAIQLIATFEKLYIPF